MGPSEVLVYDPCPLGLPAIWTGANTTCRYPSSGSLKGTLGDSGSPIRSSKT